MEKFTQSTILSPQIARAKKTIDERHQGRKKAKTPNYPKTRMRSVHDGHVITKGVCFMFICYQLSVIIVNYITKILKALNFGNW